MKVSPWVGRLGWCGLLALIFLWSCRDESPSNFDSNLPPETYISLAPAESSLAFYRAHLFWNGEDPDGFVSHYEYSLTDSNKTPGEDDEGFDGFFVTTSTDSMFSLQADLPQVLGHRFYVRAVDNEGKFDPTPAWTYFVANDFNFPNVVWQRAVATWIDAQGNTRTLNLKSARELVVTDTVGVGATASFAWTGFDIDQPANPDPEGYEYRFSEQTEFVGGTPADTAASISFEVENPTSPSDFYSGKEVLRVRAIDEAGAKTNPDSLRSFIVNFSPITWIVGLDGTMPPVRRKEFLDIDTGLTWPSGTTLADIGTGRKIQFKYTGFDDPRERVLDESNPAGIINYQYRRLLNGSGLAYKDIDGDPPPQPFPVANDFALPQAQDLTSGNWLFLVRSQDVLERYGKPDTLAINVNYFPYFSLLQYQDPDSVLQNVWIPGSPEDVVTVVVEQQGGVYPDFQLNVQAIDNHFPPPMKDPLDFNNVVEEELSQVIDYLVRLNGARTGFLAAPAGAPLEVFFPVFPDSSASDVITNGQNRLELRARDLGGRQTRMEIVFNVVLQ